MAVVGGLEIAERHVAADLRLDEGELLLAVKAFVDPGQVHAALEDAYGLGVLAGLLQAPSATGRTERTSA